MSEQEMTAQCELLRAENARLREALNFVHTVLSDPVSEAVRYNAWKVALAGLEGPEAIRGLR